MKLTAVWSEGSLLHDPEGEVWIGIQIEGDETPERGQVMRRAIDSVGIDVVDPTPYPDTAVTAVHDARMLAYLATAYDEWVTAGYPDDPGQSRVVAYAFRHPGAFDHVAYRMPKSRTAMAGVYCMDTCTVIGPGTYRGARYATDAALTAVDMVLAGAGNAYAAVRPPGHHAGTDFFGGSCYLNNAAIAAQHLVEAGVGRVAIVDIDAHHGNGTQQIFYERPDVLYTSIHVDPGEGWFPHWSGFADETGTGPGAGRNRNFPLAPGSGDVQFLDALDASCELVAATGSEALVVSLGLDAGGEDPESPLTVSNDGFSRAGSMLARLGLPTVLVQEGGYELSALERDLTAILSRFSSAGGADLEL
jgi:acetoin utilization deacetylase AcuC-like enzyme